MWSDLSINTSLLQEKGSFFSWYIYCLYVSVFVYCLCTAEVQNKPYQLL